MRISDWSSDVCSSDLLFEVPMGLLPEIGGCTATVGTTDPALFGGAIPIRGMAGDQQAATIGQACLAPGQTKATFGTGAFILSASGTPRPTPDKPLPATGLVQADPGRSSALEGRGFF